MKIMRITHLLGSFILLSLVSLAPIEVQSQALKGVKMVKTIDTLELKPMKPMPVLAVFHGPPPLWHRIVELDLRLAPLQIVSRMLEPVPEKPGTFIRDSLLYAVKINHLKASAFNDPELEQFNPYSVSVNWPPARVYKPHSFSVKYMGPDYHDIKAPIYENKETPLDKYRHFLKHPAGADTLIASQKYESPLKDLMRHTTIYNPSEVEYVWSQIPDPPKIDDDRARMNKRTVYDGFAELLQRADPETRHKLDRRDELKPTWVWGGTENVQFSQAYLQNWVKGGENSVALLSDLRVNAKYKKGDIEWESNAIHKLGVLSAGDNKTRINDDLLELNTKYGLSAGKKWFYSGVFNFKTQMFNGYQKSDVNLENPISGFMSPAYITASIGMDFKGSKNFTLLLLPFSLKLTTVLDTAKVDQTRYKIPKDRKSDWTGGASLVNKFNLKVSKEIGLVSNMDIFYGYFSGDKVTQVDWELLLDMRINVFLSTRIGTYFRYFSNESDKLQLRENLSISFRYSF